jgi:hypothetical protein
MYTTLVALAQSSLIIDCSTFSMKPVLLQQLCRAFTAKVLSSGNLSSLWQQLLPYRPSITAPWPAYCLRFADASESVVSYAHRALIILAELHHKARNADMESVKQGKSQEAVLDRCAYRKLSFAWVNAQLSCAWTIVAAKSSCLIATRLPQGYSTL